VKDIICITNRSEWRFSFVSAIKKVLRIDEANIHHIDPIKEDFKKIGNSLVDCIVISAATIPMLSIQEIFLLISKNSNSKAHIFLISEEFDQFSTILKVASFPHIHFLSAPVDFDEMANHIHTIFHPIETSGESKVSLEFLKTFVDSTKHILQDFCMLQNVTHLKPTLLKKATLKKYDLEGSILLHSDMFEGYFYLSFSKKIYLGILEKVLGEVYTEVDSGNIDFAAELVNMIYGQAKVHLNESGHNFLKVFPQFSQNPSLHITKNPVFLIPIVTEIGVIDMKVEIRNK
jgi:CheY-specific phosphatase CheX